VTHRIKFLNLLKPRQLWIIWVILKPWPIALWGYLPYFCWVALCWDWNLTLNERFSWGTTSLVHMYDNLNVAFKHNTKHLVGYVTLLWVIILIFVNVICFKLYMYYWLELLLIFFNICSLGSTSISLQLQILLLMRITIRENHVLATRSVWRHYQWRPIVSASIGWRQMLYAGYLMVITMLSKNLNSFYYFLDISDGLHLLLDTNQRGYYNNLGNAKTYRPIIL